MKILWGISASFCNLTKVLTEIDGLYQKGHELHFVCSPYAYYEDSRFMQATELMEKLSPYTSSMIMERIQDTELISLDPSFDCMILAPCTANTLAKLVNGIYDNGLLVACKMMLRNQKPIIIGYASNDALQIGAINLAKALQIKQFYLVPLGQDDCLKKPNSLVCDWKQIEATAKEAIIKKQIQPLLLSKGVNL